MIDEILENKYAIKWLSRHILNFISDQAKTVFRKLETEIKKLTNNEEHLIFNHIYIYIGKLLKVKTPK